MALSGCANTQYAGLNYAQVIGPDGETWTIISGKDQTNTQLDIKRGDITAHYKSEKEDATAALSQALKVQSDLISLILSKIPPIIAPIP